MSACTTTTATFFFNFALVSSRYVKDRYEKKEESDRKLIFGIQAGRQCRGALTPNCKETNTSQRSQYKKIAGDTKVLGINIYSSSIA